jgi:hypothetical protein
MTLGVVANQHEQANGLSRPFIPPAKSFGRRRRCFRLAETLEGKNLKLLAASDSGTR